MADSARFCVVAPLPAFAGFRRALAVDRSGLPRAVVLSFAPPEVVDDPAQLDALLRTVEAAGRVVHPGAAPILGTETVDGALAVVEQRRPGTPLRAVLDAGRTPPDVAVRIGLEVAGALAKLHAGAAAAGLAHGAVEPSCIEVEDEGEIVLCGLALVAGGDAAADVRGLGATLHECLAGEPPGDPPRRLDVPGVPEALAAAVDRASGATAPGYSSATALAEAIVAGIAAPATAAEVAAYVDAVVPPDEGERQALRRALEAGLAAAAGDAPPPPPAPAPPAAVVPDSPPPARSLDSGQTFPMPRPTRAASRLPVLVGVVALAIGFAVGFAAQRAHQPSPAAPAAPSAPARP